MKKNFILIVFFANILFAQVNYIPTTHRIYNFLNRMDVMNLLQNYDAFELPKTGKQIAKYLIQIDKEKLQLIDKQKLEGLISEFKLEIDGNTKDYISLIENDFGKLFTKSPRYLFFKNFGNGNSFNIRLLSENEFVSKKNRITSSREWAIPYKFGGEISGSISNKIGFKIQGTNGSYFGEKSILLNDPKYDNNYKFNMPDSQAGSNYFDETIGYLMYEDENIFFKFGRDRINLGFGPAQTIIGNYAPKFDYLQFNINYAFMNFSYLHGKLLQDADLTNDSQRDIIDKYFVYHRFNFNISKGTSFGFGENVIYSNRGIDISYLNPFTFYKSIEHSNQDRDNTVLFAEFKTRNLIPFVSLYFNLMIDDLDFSKIGTGWYGNKILWDVRLSTIPYLLDADVFTIQFIHVEPYFYTHHLFGNNFTNFEKTLTDNIQPNSRILLIDYKFAIRRNIGFGIMYLYSENGANTINSSGEVISNVGGNINFGHRAEDANYVKFLDGKIINQQILKIYNKIRLYRYYTFITQLQYLIIEKNEVINRYFDLRTMLRIQI